MLERKPGLPPAITEKVERIPGVSEAEQIFKDLIGLPEAMREGKLRGVGGYLDQHYEHVIAFLGTRSIIPWPGQSKSEVVAIAHEELRSFIENVRPASLKMS
ncbi:hypothetical protein KKE03_04115 [Patescibacteria group bacterium]|nr:hypothetical protein [Patescibacteria group bacterium]